MKERPVRRALVVLPPRHMTAALRHRQSRSARLRGQLRPSDDRLVSDRWARSLSGPSPACRSPVRLAARGPLACSPPPPRVPAPPRFPVHLTALRRRRAQADRAAAAQAVAAPARPNPSARACCCRRRRRSTRCPCVVRVALCMCMGVDLYVTLEPLPMIVDRYSGLDGSGGPRRRLVTDICTGLGF